MKSISKSLVVLFCFVSIGVLSITKVKAVTLSPNSGTRGANATETISVSANPQAGEQLVKLDLTVTNGTVLGFTADSFFDTVLGECGGGAKYTASSVCVSITSATATLTSGQHLGNISIKWGASGTATIVATSENQYLNSSSNIRVDSGTKGTYTLGTIPSTPLISAQTDEYLLITAGVAVITFGVYLIKQTKRHENSY